MTQRFAMVERNMAAIASANEDYRQMLQGIVKSTETLSLRSTSSSHSMLETHIRHLPKLIGANNGRAAQEKRSRKQDKEWIKAMQEEIIQQVSDHLMGKLSDISPGPHVIEADDPTILREHRQDEEQIRSPSPDSRSGGLSLCANNDCGNVVIHSPETFANSSFVARKSERRLFRKTLNFFLGVLDFQMYRSDSSQKIPRNRDGDLIEIEVFVRLSAALCKHALQLSTVYDRTHGLSSPTNIHLQLRRMCSEQDSIAFAIKEGSLGDFVERFRANGHTPDDLLQIGRETRSLLNVCVPNFLEIDLTAKEPFLKYGSCCSP